MQRFLIKILDSRPELVFTTPKHLLMIYKIYAKYVEKARKESEGSIDKLSSRPSNH